MSMAHFLFQVAHYVFQSVWVLYTAHKLGWGPREVGISLTVVGLMSAFVQGYLGRKILPILGERRAMKIALAVMAIEMTGFGFANHTATMYVLIVFGSIGGIANPAMQGLISRNVGDHEQGWIQGALTSLSSLAGIIAPPLLTGVFGFFISQRAPIELPGAPFFCSALIIVLVWVIAIWSSKPIASTQGNEEGEDPATRV
jgi:DHA1 family tetracycline resistance protein-like MFS transporter